jgi:hypothetical protein
MALSVIKEKNCSRIFKEKKTKNFFGRIDAEYNLILLNFK